MESNKTASEHFNDGVRYALTYLRDEVYGSAIMETAIWRDFASLCEGCDEYELDMRGDLCKHCDKALA